MRTNSKKSASADTRDKKKSILIVNVNWVGDVLFSTPFIRNVREAYPDSFIACLLHPRCREVLEENPHLDELIIYDEEGKHKGIFGKASIVSYLRKKNFDTVFLLHRSFTKALLSCLAGIRQRIGYATKKRGWILTEIAEEPSEELHKVEYFLNILKGVGIDAPNKDYEFFFKPSDRGCVTGLLKENGIGEDDLLIVINPGGNWGPKRWPKENFARLSDVFSRRFKAKIVISGASSDVGLASEIKELMETEPVIFCGRTNLKQLGALLERADLVVANDTGPMHMAVAVKTRVIALFGPTSPRITGPYGNGNYRVIFKNEECRTPCYDFTCTGNRCMTTIAVDDVLQVAEEVLKNKKNHDNRQG